MSYRSSRSVNSNNVLAAKRAQSEKNQKLLKNLAKLTHNKNCADCKVATNPRWASWNIGVFICIKCSGIHRSLGTHISKVKSIDLDSWTDEQVQSMVDWGNEKANMYWEHNLPQNHVPDGSRIQNFIRTKYEIKKWVSTKYIPDPKTIQTSSSEATAANILMDPVTVSSAAPAKKNSVPIAPKPAPKDDLFDLLGGLSSSPATTTSSSPAVSSSATPVTISASPAAASSSILDLNLSSNAAPAINSGRQNNRPDLKKSILALYSTPTSHSKPQNNIYQQPQVQSTGSLGANGLAGSLASLNLGQTSASTSNFGDSNIWNSSPNLSVSTSSSAAKKNGLDDDLFKNVWS